MSDVLGDEQIDEVRLADARAAEEGDEPAVAALEGGELAGDEHPLGAPADRRRTL